MPEYESSYLLLSQGFVIYVDLFVVVAIWLIYRSNKKRYLLLAISAGMAEMSRQLPDILIINYPDSTVLYQLSLLLQFTASMLFLASLLLLTSMRLRLQQLLLAIPVATYLISYAFMLVNGLPDIGFEWYLYTAPVILVTCIIVWVSAHTGNGWAPSRFLLTGTSFTLLILRIWMTPLEFGELFYLLIYLEFLVFPMMLAAMILLEVELTSERVKILLEQRIQASEDLQFIVDNSDDIILISNEAGFVQSWSLQAERKFGYVAGQVINNLHMDELFAQISIGKSKTGTAEFQTKMEARDGSWFKADVSTKTVAHRGKVYTIYVLKDVIEAV